MFAWFVQFPIFYAHARLHACMHVCAEMLISDFIFEETSGGVQATEVFCGEVFVEIDAYSHPTTGELEGLIRGTHARYVYIFIAVCCIGA